MASIYITVAPYLDLDRTQALDEQVKSFIQSCVTFASVSILAHSYFNRSSFASLQLFLIS